MAILSFGLVTDPPKPGFCKLRIKSGGDFDSTRVFVIDDQGVERELLYVNAVKWSVEVHDATRAEVSVNAAEVEADAVVASIQLPPPVDTLREQMRTILADLLEESAARAGLAP